MDDLWCSLDIAGLQSALAADPLWQPFPDSAVSSIGAGDENAYFGVADVDLMLSSPDEANNGMAVDMDASGFFGDDGRFLFQQASTSSSHSSKRSLSIDSGGSSGSFTLDASPYQAPAPAMAHHPFPGAGVVGDHDDEAIMRAMMAVMSASASPSSSASPSDSSRPSHPFRRDEAAAMPMPLPQQHLRGGNNGGHVMVKSSLAMSPPEKTQEEPSRGAAGGNNGQLYHMMSERKRREKLNDSFLTLRSLLPPCSKKDKTTVLTKAAGYLKALEAQVWELEEKKRKLERHIPAQEAPLAPQQSRRAKVQISRSEDVVNLTVMVMVECDVVELVLRVLECLRWMERISVLSVDADTYSPKVLLKAIASIKLRIMDGCDWNEASFREAMTKAVNDATSSPPTTTTTSLPPCARVPLVVTA